MSLIAKGKLKKQRPLEMIEDIKNGLRQKDFKSKYPNYSIGMYKDIKRKIKEGFYEN